MEVKKMSYDDLEDDEIATEEMAEDEDVEESKDDDTEESNDDDGDEW